MFTFITKVYKNQRKKYHFLLFIFIILSSFTFSFLAMYDAFTKYNIIWFEKALIYGIPFVGSLVAIVLCIFVAKYFIVSKKQEFSILLLAGRKPKDLFVYLIIQFGILSFLAYLFGLMGGTGIMFLINTIFKNLSSVQLNYNLSNVIFMDLCYFILMLLVILAISAHQFVRLDTDLAKYITHKANLETPAYQIKISSVKDKKKIPIFSIVITLFVLYLAGYSLIQLLDSNQSFIDLLMTFTLALTSEILIINTTIPLLYDLLHNHYLLKHPLLMNGLSSFNEFAKVMITLINLSACIFPIMLFLLLSSSSYQFVEFIILPSLMMSVIMMSLCFILRFKIYIIDQKASFSTLYAIGYTSRMIHSISAIKNIIFLLFVILIPFAFLTELFYKAYHENLLNIEIIIGTAGTYLVIYLGMMIYMFIKERLIQKEVFNNVKHFNRG